jgi:hypothetical protein
VDERRREDRLVGFALYIAVCIFCGVNASEIIFFLVSLFFF